MGNQTCGSDDTYENRFRTKYEFISVISDHNFGEVKIYRKKQMNFDYVMVLHKYIQGASFRALLKEVQALHASFLEQDEPMALRIFNFEMNEGTLSNCSLSLVNIYMEYFNFTLYDLIEARKQRGECFSHAELIYILTGCVQTFNRISSITGKNLVLKTSLIYLSPEGHLKFCPIRPQQFYQHAYPICNSLCTETVYKQVASHDRAQKYLLQQVKKIFQEISQLNFDHSAEFGKVNNLFHELNKCQNIDNLVQALGPPKVENLVIAEKTQESSTSCKKPDSQAKSISLPTKGPNSNSEFSERVKLNDYDNTKLSLTRSAKNYRR